MIVKHPLNRSSCFYTWHHFHIDKSAFKASRFLFSISLALNLCVCLPRFHPLEWIMPSRAEPLCRGSKRTQCPEVLNSKIQQTTYFFSLSMHTHTVPFLELEQTNEGTKKIQKYINTLGMQRMNSTGKRIYRRWAKAKAGESETGRREKGV